MIGNASTKQNIYRTILKQSTYHPSCRQGGCTTRAGVLKKETAMQTDHTREGVDRSIDEECFMAEQESRRTSGSEGFFVELIDMG